MARPRWQGDTAVLAALLGGFVKKSRWLKYSELLKGVRVNAAVILNHKRLVRGLHKLQGNLCFAQSSLEEAFSLVVVNKKVREVWFEDQGEVDSFCETAARRLRCILRHVRQGSLTKKGAVWFKSLGLEGGVGVEESDGEENGCGGGEGIGVEKLGEWKDNIQVAAERKGNDAKLAAKKRIRSNRKGRKSSAAGISSQQAFCVALAQLPVMWKGTNGPLVLKKRTDRKEEPLISLAHLLRGTSSAFRQAWMKENKKLETVARKRPASADGSGKAKRGRKRKVLEEVPWLAIVACVVVITLHLLVSSKVGSMFVAYLQCMAGKHCHGGLEACSKLSLLLVYAACDWCLQGSLDAGNILDVDVDETIAQALDGIH
eukprot:3363547-Amphidinium_carterae.1